MLVTLEPVGPVSVTTSAHTMLLVGEAARGPTDLVGMTSALSAFSYYYDGDLKNNLEDAFGEGVPRIYAKRVLGLGYASSTEDLTDGLDSPSDVLTATAKSPGSWGNALSVTVIAGLIKHAEQGYCDGNGTSGYYTLNNCAFISPQPASAYIKVGNVARTIVYDENDLGTGKVFLDVENGKFKFYTDALPDDADQITYKLWYYGVDVSVTDNITLAYREDIKDLDDFVAALGTSSLVDAEIITGQTHLPAIGVYKLIGGTDGAAIDADAWEQALNEASMELGKAQITPTTAALCAYECQASTYDLHVIASQWTMMENVKFRPTLMFVPTAPSQTPEDMIEESEKRSNRHLCIVYPSWDESERRKNLAVLEAAREAALPFGEDAIKAENRLKGANGLHGDLQDTLNDDYVLLLSTRGIYVMVKTLAGVGPVKAITTDKTDQFSLTVDQRTANRIIDQTHNVLMKFMGYRNDNDTRADMLRSVNGFMLNHRDILKTIYDFVTTIWPDSIDPNFVHVEMKFIPMGHVHWIDVQMKMGPYADLRALQATG